MEREHAHQNGAFTATFNLEPFPLPPLSLDPEQFRYQLFWPFHNINTDQLSWKTYSATFADVAETDKHIDLNPLSFKLHLFEIAFYELVYKSLAQHGTCFGFCLESIYARENTRTAIPRTESCSIPPVRNSSLSPITSSPVSRTRKWLMKPASCMATNWGHR